MFMTVLDNWNVNDIQNSGDSVKVSWEDVAGNTELTFQWQEGDQLDSLWSAIGLDTIFYNTTTYIGVSSVRDQGGNDVSSDWNLNFGGTTAGGGFGSFISKKNLEGGGTGGIAPDSITFVLDGIAQFASNGAPTNSTFATHIRYGDGCSGWASDGSTTSDTTGSGGCAPVQVSEPGTLALLGLGLIGLAFVRRRRQR